MYLLIISIRGWRVWSRIPDLVGLIALVFRLHYLNSMRYIFLSGECESRSFGIVCMFIFLFSQSLVLVGIKILGQEKPLICWQFGFGWQSAPSVSTAAVAKGLKAEENTVFIYGVVIFTGRDTKVIQTQQRLRPREAPLKKGLTR